MCLTGCPVDAPEPSGPGVEHSDPIPDPPAVNGSAPVEPESSSLDELLDIPRPGDRALAQQRTGQALRLQQAARWRDALTAFEEAVEADPTFAEARVAFGLFLLQPSSEQNTGRALRQFRYARLLAPDDGRAVCGEGIARARLSDFERARATLGDPRASLDPQRHPAFAAESELARALLAEEANAPGQAEAHYREASELFAGRRLDQARALVQWAAWLDESDRADEAEALLRQVVRDLQPTHARAHHQLSRLLKREGEAEAAARHRRLHELLTSLQEPTKAFREDAAGRIAARREIVRLFPEYARASFDLVREMIEVKAHDEAVGEIERVAFTGWTAELHYLRAKCHAGRGDLGAARADVTRMKKLNPRTPPEVLQDVLEVWAARPEVPPEEVQRIYQEWARGW